MRPICMRIPWITILFCNSALKYIILTSHLLFKLNMLFLGNFPPILSPKLILKVTGSFFKIFKYSVPLFVV